MKINFSENNRSVIKLQSLLSVFGGILTVGIAFSVVLAAAPTPVGHIWAEIENFTCGAGNCLQANTSGSLTCVDCGGGDGDITAVFGVSGLVGTTYSGDASVSLNTGGISTCTNSINNKIYWSGTRLECGTDQTGSAGVTGSGSSNYIPKWSSSSNITNSQIYDNGTAVGIGTTGPGTKLHVAGDMKANGYIMPGTYLDMYGAASGVRDYAGSYGSTGQVLTKGSSGVAWQDGGSLLCETKYSPSSASYGISPQHASCSTGYSLMGGGCVSELNCNLTYSYPIGSSWYCYAGNAMCTGAGQVRAIVRCCKVQ